MDPCDKPQIQPFWALEGLGFMVACLLSVSLKGPCDPSKGSFEVFLYGFFSGIS